MDIWSILKIEKTADKEAIRRAYRTKLREVHPEDDPEGFKLLREAYERALRGEEETADGLPGKKAGSQGEAGPAGETADVFSQGGRGQAQRALKELYASFARRIDPKEWQVLLDMDYFTMLDTSDDGMRMILTAVLNNPAVPQSVLALLNRRYSLTERADELSDTIPLSFFQYLERRLMRPDQITFSLMRGPEKADYDEYIRLFTELRRAVMQGSIPEQEKHFRLLRKMDIQYPGLDEMYARYLLQTNRREEAERLSEVLAGAYPFFDAFLLRADMMSLRGDRRALRLNLDRCCDFRPKDPSVMLRLARLEAEEGKYEEARERLMEEIRRNPYDIFMRSEMVNVTKLLADDLKEKLRQDEGNKDKMLELARAYFQTRMFREALDILLSFSPEEKDRPVYLDYLGRSYLSLRKEKESIPVFEEWLRLIDNLPAGQEYEKEKKKRDHVLLLMGAASLAVGDLAGAEEYLDKALPQDEEDIDIWYENRIELTYRQGDYFTSVRLCRELIGRKRISYTGMLYQAKCALKRGVMEEALFYASQAMEIYPYMIDPYEVMIRVYILNKQYMHAMQVIERYENIGIPSVSCSYYRALILKEQEKPTEALRILTEKDNLASDRELCDMHHPEDFYILKGELLEKLRDPHKALQAYKEAEKLAPDHERIHGMIGVLLCKLHRFEEAEAHLNRQIEKKSDTLYLVTLGMCLRESYRPDDAVAVFCRAIAEHKVNDKTLLYIAGQLKEMCFPEHADKVYRMSLEAGISGNDRKRAMQGLAEVLADLKRTDEAGNILMEMSEGAPLSLEARLLFAKMAMREGRFREASDILQGLLMNERKELWPDILSLRGENLMRAAEKEMLEYQVARAVEGKFTTEKLMMDLARLYLWMGEWKKAENHLLQAEALYPGDSAEHHLLLAEAAIHQFGSRGRVNRYLDMVNIRKRMIQEPDSRMLVEARVLLLQGDAEKAGAAAERLLERLQWQGEYSERAFSVFLLLARCAAMQKDSSRELVYYEKALSAYGRHTLLEKKCEELKRK